MNTSKPAHIHLAAAHESFRAGNLNECHAHLLQVAPADRDIDWHILRGVGLAMQGALSEAEALLQQQVSQHPEHLALRINLGMVQRDSGHSESALSTFAIARTQHPDSALAWHNLGLTQMELRNWNGAAESLFQAAQRAPEQLDIRIHAACALARGGHDSAARAALASLGSSPSLNTENWLQMGATLMALKENRAAQHAYAQVLEQAPGQPEALMNAAVLKEQANRPEDATLLLGALADAYQQHPLTGLVKARLHGRIGAFEDALASLPEGNIDSPDLAVEVQFERARLLDALGRYSDAFTAAEIANQGAQHLRPGADSVLDGLLAATVSPADMASWPRDTEQPDTPQPIFVLGLPRSGSTLLDLMLDGHTQLQVLSEKPCLEELIPQIEEQTNRTYPAALNVLTEEQIQQLQLHYFDCANRQFEDGREPGTRLVDKNPLNILRLPLIRRIFPGATIIRTHRDLNDTALSCFFHDLGGRGAQGFWSIPQSLDLLQRIESFADTQEENGHLPPIHVHYETLVTKPEATLQELCNALGLAFESTMLNTANTAQGRGAIGTPSYVEVTKAPNRQRIGRWKHYADYYPA